jgi:hypothetical protein
MESKSTRIIEDTIADAKMFLEEYRSDLTVSRTSLVKIKPLLTQGLGHFYLYIAIGALFPEGLCQGLHRNYPKEQFRKPDPSIFHLLQNNFLQ